MPIPKPKVDELIEKNKSHYCPEQNKSSCVKIAAVADLPSRFGTFQIVAFYNDHDDKDHVAIIHGDVSGKQGVPVRMHSECLTGDVIGSLRCDCRDQLEASLKAIEKFDEGIVLYLRQEGRGIGLLNKIKAYQLQDAGRDTVEANQALRLPDDARDYGIAAHMLKSLQVQSIKLMTNNPQKIEDLERHGVKIEGRMPLIIEPNEFNKKYLDTKKEKMGHLLGGSEQGESKKES